MEFYYVITIYLRQFQRGKTEYIYRKIVKEAAEDPKKDYLVIVPEQFTNADTETAGKAFFKPCHHEY